MSPGNRWWTQKGSEMFSLLFGEMKLRTARPSEGVGGVLALVGGNLNSCEAEPW